MTKTQRPVDPPQEVNTHKKIIAWAREIIQYEEMYGGLDETFR